MLKVVYHLILYDKRLHCLYAHINKVNNRIYFGITKEYIKNRWGGGSGYVKCTKFYAAIKKYGWDGFHHIVILKNLSESEALFFEKSYISLYNTTDREFGYNTDAGRRISKISAEAKRRMIAEKRMKPIICLETMQRYWSQAEIESIDSRSHSYIKDACKSKGSRVHNGMHFLYIEDYIKMSHREIQDILDGKLQNHKEVVCMETGEVFWDATKAGQVLSYGKFSVSNRCLHFKERGRDNLAGGYHWAFREDYDRLSQEEIERVINLDNFKVVCLETGKTYKNPKVAARETGANEGSIRRCCQGTLRYSKGLHWMYEKEYKKASLEDIEKILSKPRKDIEGVRIKEVVCLETKKIYKNIKIASKETGACPANISKSCKSGDGFKSGGFHWMFREDYDETSSDEIKDRLKRRKIISKRAKPVICLETKVEFRCAGEVNGIAKGNITACCLYNSGRPNKLRKNHFLAGGYHWLYKEDYEKFSEEKIQQILNHGKQRREKQVETCKETHKETHKET